MSRPPHGGDDDRIRVEVKRELRKRMLAVRGAIPAVACEARSREIAKRILALPQFGVARTVLAFAPIRREVRTAAVMDAAWSQGKRVALPRVTETGLALFEVDATTVLVDGAFGVSEPPETATRVEPADVDFALIPALAVDPEGHRIGYGGGYYDRLLPTMTNACACVVAFDFQLIAEVPRLATDAAADLVVTDDRLIEVG